MVEKDDDLFIEGAKRLKQLIQDKNIKPVILLTYWKLQKEP